MNKTKTNIPTKTPDSSYTARPDEQDNRRKTRLATPAKEEQTWSPNPQNR